MIQKLFAVAALSCLFAAGGAFAQTAADNIRPARQVCLAGQPCVGNKVGTTAQPAAAAPVAAAPMASASVEEAAEVEEVVEVAASGFDAEATYMASCNACHAAGVANAPKLGDKAAWDARMEKGMDAIMVNVMNGINAMPAKGLCMTCSADDLQEIVNYMVAK
ncbi:MAG: c-type cytochrome [Proteobacteria bacterium]|nr:c-type cytochrome [Pseudomonadota bacterium]